MESWTWSRPLMDRVHDSWTSPRRVVQKVHVHFIGTVYDSMSKEVHSMSHCTALHYTSEITLDIRNKNILKEEQIVGAFWSILKLNFYLYLSYRRTLKFIKMKCQIHVKTMAQCNVTPQVMTQQPPAPRPHSHNTYSWKCTQPFEMGACCKFGRYPSVSNKDITRLPKETQLPYKDVAQGDPNVRKFVSFNQIFSIAYVRILLSA